jgi:hypothetical protein
MPTSNTSEWLTTWPRECLSRGGAKPWKEGRGEAVVVRNGRISINNFRYCKLGCA